MSADDVQRIDARMDAAIAELQDLIRSHYPTATFNVGAAEDPEGVYMRVIVDVEDTDEVIDIFLDRLVDLQVKEMVPLYVVPVRTSERIAAAQQRRHKERTALPLPAA